LTARPAISPRPSLTLQIEQLAVPPLVPTPSIQPDSTSSSAKPGSASPGLFTSTQDDQWAVRPPVENVYDHMEKFFPNHDLDKPIVDAGIGITSPVASATQSNATSAIEAPLPQKFKHKKSIRLIAQDRKRLLQQKTETAIETAINKIVPDTVTSLLRRRSTRLWGTRTEEVKVGKAGSTQISTINESPSSAHPENCKPPYR
jgi:hypothetical protein